MTENQMRVLHLIHEKKASMLDCTALLGTTVSAGVKVINNLKGMGLIEPVMMGEGIKYLITQKGLTAIKKNDIHSPSKEDVVAPRTFVYVGETYIPEKNVYYRNTGNKHSPSRGF